MQAHSVVSGVRRSGVSAFTGALGNLGIENVSFLENFHTIYCSKETKNAANENSEEER